MKKVILALVALAVVALAYITIQSVLAPVNFDKKQAKIEGRAPEAAQEDRKP